MGCAHHGRVHSLEITRATTRWAGRHAMILAAAVAAAVSAVAVPPSRTYLDYVEPRTMAGLFAVLAAIAALERAHVVTALAERVVASLPTRRRLVTGLVVATAVASMLVTNDLALLALLPVAAVALRDTGADEHLAWVFVLQAAAANLGGMITPFGSPHNLVLFQYYGLSVGEFVQILALPFAVAMIALVLLCRRVPDAPVAPGHHRTRVPGWPTALYVVLFVTALAIVLRLAPPVTALGIAGVLLVVDRRALLAVDYELLLTFVLFFIVAGNLTRLSVVDETLSSLLTDHVMLWAAAASQVISNVPVAIVFAPFTDDSTGLLLGVNIGGVGTVVASLASLIALREFQLRQPHRTHRFLVLFTAVNLGLLVGLLAITATARAVGVL